MRAPSKQSGGADFGYRHLAVAVDNSPHASRAVEQAVALAVALGAELTGVHAYAAQLHDVRFRQMEGGLPARYHQEDELARQRRVHDDLITRGLEVITDAYLDGAAAQAAAAGLELGRRSVEGKNYRALLDDVAASDYDLVVLGARGLGSVKRGTLGTVCERVVRRLDRDALVVRAAARPGPIVVAIDGSARAFGALRVALELAKALGRAVEVVSAFDPFFHYVAFESIAEVLSDEAGEIFRFKEQEALHEEVIDSGLARIYRAHLAVAERVAEAEGASIEIRLLAGKPYEAILDHLAGRACSLLVIGRTGVHADAGLDIGGNAENLLRLAPCDVLLCARGFTPPIEAVAAESISWTAEAEARLGRAPSFVQDMARGAVLRFAHERGHTVITSDLVDDAMGALLPVSAMEAMGMVAQAAAKRARLEAQPKIRWHPDAQAALETLPAEARHAAALRAVKLARTEGAAEIDPALLARAGGPG